MESKIGKWMSENWRWLLSMIALGALGYAEYTNLQYRVERLENRVQTWIERQEIHNSNSNNHHSKEQIDNAEQNVKIKHLEDALYD